MLRDFDAEWRLKRDTPERWDVLREVYRAYLPDILRVRAHAPMARSDPYFLDWDFTPIERLAWADIRGLGLPFYPQVPVGKRFIDFGDPFYKIGVELDGKEFHEIKRDTLRDQELWALGWRVFHIPGSKSLPCPDPVFTYEWCERRDCNPRAAEAEVEDWMSDWSEGIFWSLKLAYYHRHERYTKYLGAAERVLDSHRLVEFPLAIPEADHGEN